jgi:hypothetical protein
VVADTIQLLADDGYPDSFVELMWVVTGVDAQLEWADETDTDR